MNEMSKDVNTIILTDHHSIHDYCKFDHNSVVTASLGDVSFQVRDRGLPSNLTGFLVDCSLYSLRESQQVSMASPYPYSNLQTCDIVPSHMLDEEGNAFSISSPQTIEVKEEEVIMETIIDESDSLESDILLECDTVKEEQIVDMQIHNEHDEGEDDEQNKTDSSITKRLWTDSYIKLMLDCRYECDDLFTSPDEKLNPWIIVHEKMLEYRPEFPGTDDDCANKFRIMTVTYLSKKALENSDTIYWPWFEDMDRILGSASKTRPRPRYYYDTMTNLALQGKLSEVVFSKNGNWNVNHNNSSSSRIVWSDENIKLLLDTRELFSEEFKKPVKQTKIWKAITNQMCDLNPDFRESYTSTYDKWRNLMGSYKQNKLKEGKRGRDFVSWIWYDDMDRILGWKPEDVENSEFKDFTGLSRGSSLSRNKPHPKFLRSHIRERYYSADRKNLWIKSNTKLLIKFREESEDIFLNPKRKLGERENWGYIRDMILSINPKFSGTPRDCASKWRSLNNYYYLVKEKRKSTGTAVYWEWYEDMDRILSPQTVDDNPVILVEGENDVFMLASDLVTSEGTKEAKANIESKLWNEHNTNLLIRACESINLNQENKHHLWKTIRKNILTMDPHFGGSTKDCSSKWRNLMTTYHTNKRKRETLGRRNISWEWFDDMDGIVMATNGELDINSASGEDLTDDNEQSSGQVQAKRPDADFDALRFDSKLWSESNIQLLLNTREEYKELFKMPNTKGMSPWKYVRERMVSLNPGFTGSGTDLSGKWRNLKQTYRMNKSKADNFGREQVTWEWYDYMDRIISNTPVKPDNAVTIPSERNEQIGEDDATYMMMMPDPYPTTNEDDTVDVTKTDNSKSKRFWSRNNIKLLVYCRTQCDQFFKNPQSTKSCAWEKVKEKMVERNPNFIGTSLDCSSKWRNLCVTYRILKRKGKTVTSWEWFQLLDHILSKRKLCDDPALYVASSMYDDVELDQMDTAEGNTSQGAAERKQNILHNDWFRDYLTRKEQRDIAAESREERLLSIMEQLLSLEQKRLQNLLDSDIN